MKKWQDDILKSNIPQTGIFKDEEMESKYYTPSIEEFHVGFEYEVFQKGQPYNADYPLQEVTEPIWETYKIPDPFVGYRVDKLLESCEVRVKYLDREDIESLGFENTDEGVADATYVMKIDNWRQVNIHCNQGEDSDRLHLELRKDNNVHIHNGGSYEQYDGLMLKIKNKSELVTLLKQLGI